MLAVLPVNRTRFVVLNLLACRGAENTVMRIDIWKNELDLCVVSGGSNQLHYSAM